MKGGLWKKIKRVALTDVTVLVKGINRDALDDVERVLAEADFGPTAFELAENLEEEFRRGTLKTEDAVRAWLKSKIVTHLELSSREAAESCAGSEISNGSRRSIGACQR